MIQDYLMWSDTNRQALCKPCYFVKSMIVSRNAVG